MEKPFLLGMFLVGVLTTFGMMVWIVNIPERDEEREMTGFVIMVIGIIVAVCALTAYVLREVT